MPAGPSLGAIARPVSVDRCPGWSQPAAARGSAAARALGQPRGPPLTSMAARAGTPTEPWPAWTPRLRLTPPTWTPPATGTVPAEASAIRSRCAPGPHARSRLDRRGPRKARRSDGTGNLASGNTIPARRSLVRAYATGSVPRSGLCRAAADCTWQLPGVRPALSLERVFPAVLRAEKSSHLVFFRTRVASEAATAGKAGTIMTAQANVTATAARPARRAPTPGRSGCPSATSTGSCSAGSTTAHRTTCSPRAAGRRRTGCPRSWPGGAAPGTRPPGGSGPGRAGAG